MSTESIACPKCGSVSLSLRAVETPALPDYARFPFALAPEHMLRVAKMECGDCGHHFDAGLDDSPT